jgi:putative membrane protein
MEPLIAYLHYLAIIRIAGFLAALLALATGLLRLFFSLSIKPTVSFIRWRRRLAESGELPPTPEIATARRLLHVEVALLALIPLMAVLMARGIGR